MGRKRGLRGPDPDWFSGRRKAHGNYAATCPHEVALRGGGGGAPGGGPGGGLVLTETIFWSRCETFACSIKLEHQAVRFMSSFGQAWPHPPIC